MLAVAGTLLDAESQVKSGERETFLAGKCPPLELPYSKDELTVRWQVHHGGNDQTDRLEK